jgi:hypothetical protein
MAQNPVAGQGLRYMVAAPLIGEGLSWGRKDAKSVVKAIHRTIIAGQNV